MIAPTPAPVPIFCRLAPDAFALERLGHGGADRIRAAVDRDPIERDRHASPCGRCASALLTELTTPRIDRAGRDEDAVALVTQIDHRRRLEAILDLRGLGAERVLQPDVELGADRDLVRVLRAAAVPPLHCAAGTWRWSIGARRRSPRLAACTTRGVAAGAAPDVVDAIAHVGVVAARDRLVLPQLDLQIDRLVARVVELRLELRRQSPSRASAAARRRATRRRSCPGAAECRRW